MWAFFVLPLLVRAHTLLLRSCAWKRSFCFSLFRVWMAMRQPCFPPRKARAENLSVRTNAADGGAKPRLGEALRFVSTALHSSSNGGSTRRAFQRGRLRSHLRRRVSLRLNCFSWLLRSNRAQPKRRLQVSQDDSRNLTNIATEFAHRQPNLCASYQQPAAAGRC